MYSLRLLLVVLVFGVGETVLADVPASDHATVPAMNELDVSASPSASNRAAFGWLNYSTLGVYLGGMVAIGWFCARRNKNTNDYFKAAGRIPWRAAGISINATVLSSITFMAIPAKANATDWT